MNMNQLTKIAKEHLNVLCSEISERRVGCEGNRQATDYVKNVFRKFGWKTTETPLSVMDWKTEGAVLTCEEQTFEVFSSPYSLGCSAQGELLPINSLEQLKQSDLKNKIVLLYGEIAKEQIFPKNFVFYVIEEHQQLIAALEQGQPQALICATGLNPELAGGMYPFPMFEDGDFDIPSVYMKDVDGEKLLAYGGKTVRLESKAERIPEVAYNVVGEIDRKAEKRIVITAHIDAKIGTPGAIDNATGVTVLLLLADLLRDYNGKYTIEMVAFNGEDYYAVSGQMKYIEQNNGKFDDILLNINIDGAGFHIGNTCFSAFDLPDNIQNAMNRVIENNATIVEGLPWVQGDHSIFLQFGCPAIAISSDDFIRNFANQDITHTPKDNLSIVNYDRVAECALAINKLVNGL